MPLGPGFVGGCCVCFGVAGCLEAVGQVWVRCGSSMIIVHEHMFVFGIVLGYPWRVESSLADIVAEGFVRLSLYVSEHSLSGDDVVAVRRLVDAAEFVCTQTVSEFTANTEFRGLGHRDVGSWLSTATGARRTEGHSRCEQARLLGVLREVNSAVLAGTFSASQLRCLSASVTRRREPSAVRDQTVFVNAAKTLDASQFGLLVQRWAALVDDELCDPTRPGKGDEWLGRATACRWVRRFVCRVSEAW